MGLVGEGISVGEALDYYYRHLFQAQLLWQWCDHVHARVPFPVAVPCPFLLAGQNGISRDRRTEKQNVWDKRAGTERLGSAGVSCEVVYIYMYNNLNSTAL